MNIGELNGAEANMALILANMVLNALTVIVLELIRRQNHRRNGGRRR